MKHDELGERMKSYEYVTRTHLMKRTPVIIRIDGRAFHTFTRGFKKPFDEILVKSMQETMKYLCENVQGCVLGYTQSDEITLVLVDYKELDTSAWFDYNIQKCASIAASMATMKFNQVFGRIVEEELNRTDNLFDENGDVSISKDYKYLTTIAFAANEGAMFDARVFNIPKEEVCNNILWRQNDAVRNSIEMVGHANFTQKELHKKSCNDIQNMLMTEKGINWNDFPTCLKRGCCCVKALIENSERAKWIIDTEIPIFKGRDRQYIEKLIFVGE